MPIFEKWLPDNFNRVWFKQYDSLIVILGWHIPHWKFDLSYKKFDKLEIDVNERWPEAEMLSFLGTPHAEKIRHLTFYNLRAPFIYFRDFLKKCKVPNLERLELEDLNDKYDIPRLKLMKTILSLNHLNLIIINGELVTF